ncbi:MAG: AMP-binding enzyme family protein [Bradyrhizobium sp.]|nr:AMP-binding enzyme family protein [Bradyrhizobium sp.]
MDGFDWDAFGLQPPVCRIDPPVGPRDIASLLEQPLLLNPGAEALADPERRFSFAELDAAIDAAAALFARLGVGPGDRIAASMINRCDLVIGFFASMRLGAVWVGINRILPASDKLFILGHSGARLLLADTGIAAEIDAMRAAVPALADIVTVDGDAPDDTWRAVMDGTADSSPPRPMIDPFVPAAIMYTSGTTGLPKGVVHSQHNMVTLVAAVSAHGLMSPQARRGAVLPVTITNVMILGAVFAFWNNRPFILGQSAKTLALVDWIRRERIGQVALVPTMIYDILQADLDLPDFLKAGCGGAPLPESIRIAFEARHGYPIQPSYGLTEAPTVVALPPRDGNPPPGASGMPLPHLAVTIRDDAGNLLPIGDVGEICITAVAAGPWADIYAPPLGYWREPEKTQQLLRGGVTHSGDHGSLDSGGWLSIADRSSELILRGGSNVYPAEIERVLHSHDGVADCAVIGMPDARLGQRTLAVIQPADAHGERNSLVASLTALCAETLVRYKMPDDWAVVDQFPRNAMGKIRKAHLREEFTGKGSIHE